LVRRILTHIGTPAEPPRDRPRLRTASLGGPVGRCRTGLGGSGATVTRACLQPAGAVV